MSSEEMMNRPESSSAGDTRYETIAPTCDVYENADEYLIHAEMPGVDKHAIDVRIERTRLSIEAYRNLTDAAEGSSPGGRMPTRYVRTFEVPDTIEADEITARLENGVLDLRLPKAPHARVRRISVTAG
jgi:HSP20 family protein